MKIPTWFLPSWYGDIRLDTKDDDKTQVTFYKLSRSEVLAMDKLRKHSVKKKWATQEQWDAIPLRAFETGDVSESYITLDAAINKVEKVLTSVLKPERKTVRVVKFEDGTLQEVREGDFEDEKAPDPPPPDDPFRAEDDQDRKQMENVWAMEERRKREKEEAEKAEAAKKAEAATTVAQPNQGCPAPDFETVKKKATAVLKAFLTPQQCADFDKHQRFIVTGVDTGHRYVITSRHAPDELRNGQFKRTVYDLDEERPFCVHDWEIPAEEECLTMALLLQLPGRESYIRAIPEPV